MKKIKKNVRFNDKKAFRLLMTMTIVYMVCLVIIFYQETLSQTQNNKLLDGLDIFWKDGRYVALLTMIAFIVISCSLVVYFNSFHKSLIIVKQLGATNAQMFIVGMGRAFVSQVIAIVVGTLIGSIVTLVIIRFIDFNVISTNVIFNWSYYFQIVVTTSVYYILSYSILILLNANLEDKKSFYHSHCKINQTQISRNELKAGILSERNININRKILVIQYVVWSMAILVTSISVQKIIEKKQIYDVWNNLKEYVYDVKTDRLADGLSEESIKYILEMPGMESADCQKVINDKSMQGEIKICWKGWRDSRYVNTHRIYSQVRSLLQPHIKVDDCFVLDEIRGISSKDYEQFYEYNLDMEYGFFNEEEFDNGNECILFLTPFEVRDRGYSEVDLQPVYTKYTDGDEVYQYEFDEKSIQVGDIINVITPYGEEEIKVGGIVIAQQMNGCEIIAVGEKFIDRLCGLENRQLYNRILFNYSDIANCDELDNKVNEYISNLNQELTITNRRLVYEEIARQCLDECFRYIFCTVVSFIFFSFVIYRFNNEYFQNERKRIGILLSLGIEKKQLSGMYLFIHIKASFLSGLISTVFLVVYCLYLIRIETSFDSVVNMFEEIRNHEELIGEYIRCYLLVAVIILMLHLIILYVVYRKIVQRGIIPNIKDE